jgi:hypothetical protein
MGYIKMHKRKNAQGLFNNVTEKTRSKVVKSRKSNAKA